VGELRWAKPAPPIVSTQVHDGSEGRSCTQSRAAAAASPTAPGEDCLFLDLTVPMAAIKDPSKKLPVVDWVYGGAYIVGSKEQR
jgi:carboxylesterase type B